MGEKPLASTECLQGPPAHQVVGTLRSVAPGWRLAIEYSFAGVHRRRAAPKINKTGRERYLSSNENPNMECGKMQY